MSLIFRPDPRALRDKPRASSSYAFSPVRTLAAGVERLSISGTRREQLVESGRGRWIPLTEQQVREQQKQAWSARMLELDEQMLSPPPPLFSGQYWWDETLGAWSYVPQLGPRERLPSEFEEPWYDEQGNQWYDMAHLDRGPVPARQPTETEAYERSVDPASRHAGEQRRQRHDIVFASSSSEQPDVK